MPKMRLMRRVLFALSLLFFFTPGALSESSAAAQGTGGSFGGSNFGSGDGTSSGGGSGGGGNWGSGGGNWGGGSSYERREQRYQGAGASDGYRPSGGAQPTPTAVSGAPLGTFGMLVVIGFTGLFGVVIVTMIVRGKRMQLPVGAHPNGGVASSSMSVYSGPNAMHVQRLSLGIDWRSRRDVQDALKALAETGNTSSPEGLAHLLREAVITLRRAEMGWLYVARENLGSFAPQRAEERFRQLATEMRASFQHEIVRSDAGALRANSAPEMRAHPNEGAGTVVVHLIIASRKAIAMGTLLDAQQIRAALDACGALSKHELVALEVVWSPAAENDRMSTAELEQNYPDMKLIDPASIAGRIFCSYCQGPFAMELLSCPHCGAPAEASR